jgi:hypothetical protein
MATAEGPQARTLVRAQARSRTFGLSEEWSLFRQFRFSAVS